MEDRPTPLTWSTIPLDYDVRIRAVRQGLGLSQARFAELVGAARRAVVYQWESRKRTPSPVFWRRIEKLCPTWDGRDLTSVGGRDDRARSGGA